MSAYLLPSRHLAPSMLVSATNQGGLRPLDAKPAAGNVGALTLSPSGTPTAALNEVVKIVADGDLGTATYKRSADGGANYLGRRADSTWDGNGATERTINDTTCVACSEPVEYDSDGDGVPDVVLVAVYGILAHTKIDIYQTTDFSLAGAWTLRKADCFSVTMGGKPIFLNQNGRLVLICMNFAFSSLLCSTSMDGGTTWSAGATAATSVGATFGGQPSGFLLASGRMLVSFADSDGANTHVYCTSSANGNTWRARKLVTASAAVNYASNAVVQVDGKTVAFCERVTATGQIIARQCTDADPAKASATWAAYSETLWAADTNDAELSACVAPDGTIYVAFSDTNTIQFSKLKGAGTFSAAATLLDIGDNVTTPSLGVVGGALWCAYLNATDGDINVVGTKYWGAYHTTNYPASWTGTSPQFFGSGLWCSFGGSDGQDDDTYTITSQYDYGADRSVRLDPTRPTRATGDGADWEAIFDFGANVLVPIDTIAAIANVEHLHHQQDAAATFDSDGGSPTRNTALSFVQETVAAASVTWAAGKVTRASGSWEPGTLTGKYLRAATTGQVQQIDDNDATDAYVHGVDMSAYTGDLQILSGRAWTTQTKTELRYMRQLIENQETDEGRYEIAAYAAGQRITLPDVYAINQGDLRTVEEDELPDGTPQRTRAFPVRRAWVVDVCGMTDAEKARLAALFAAQGTRPLVLIPDSTNYFDFALVLSPKRIAWDRGVTSFELVEVG